MQVALAHTTMPRIFVVSVDDADIRALEKICSCVGNVRSAFQRRQCTRKIHRVGESHMAMDRNKDAEREVRIDDLVEQYRRQTESLCTEGEILENRARATITRSNAFAERVPLTKQTRRRVTPEKILIALEHLHDEQSLIEAVLDATIAATGADFGNVQLVMPSNGTLRIAAHRGFSPAFLNFFRVVREDKSACSAALHHGARIVVPNVNTSSIYTDATRRAMLAAQARACQSTPIVSSIGKVLGIVSTHFKAPHRPTRRQLTLVDLIVKRAADVLEARSNDATRPSPETVRNG